MKPRLLLILAILSIPALTRAQEDEPTAVARTTMKKVFTYAKRLGLKSEGLSAEIYSQFGFRTTRRSRYARYLPQFFRFEQGTNEYYGETHLNLSIDPHAGSGIHEYGSYSTHPNADKLRLRTALNFAPSLYEGKLFFDRLLSPLNSRNRRYYRYYCQDGVKVDSTGEARQRIKIVPRFYNTQLVTGYVDVDTLSGAVRFYSFSFYYEMTRFRISGYPGREGLASLYPERFNIATRSSVLGNSFNASFIGHADYSFAVPKDSIPPLPRRKRFDLTEQYLQRIDTTKAVHTQEYFDSVRHYPLPRDAQEAYKIARQREDSLAKAEPVEREKSGMEEAFDFLFGRHRWDVGNSGRLKLPAIITPEMFSWSKRKGFVIQTRMRLDLDLSKSSRLSIVPKASYSFGQHEFYWRLPVRFSFAPRREMMLSFETGNGNHIYSGIQAEEVRRQMQGSDNFSELDRLLNSYDFNFYRDFYMRLDYSVKPLTGLKFEAGLRYHRRSLIGWGEEAASHGMKRHAETLAPRLHAEWTPCLYYYRDTSGRRVPLYSHWPTLRLDYERGFSTGSLETSYERIEFDAAYVIQLYALRSIYLRGGGGFYTRRGAGYFLDFDYFCDENLPEGWQDAMSGRFYALGNRWYNESRYYARFSATYESPMLLFSRLKWLARVVQRERIYANIVSLNSLNPYAELGYGISTHVLDVSGFLGIAPGKDLTLGAHIIMHF